MKKELLLLGVVALIIFVAGCTSSNNQSSEQETTEVDNQPAELLCSGNEDICVLGEPGFLGREYIMSNHDITYTVTLRNNLYGREAKNVKVQLKNVGPFKIVEGVEHNEVDGSCVLTQGVWSSGDIRTIVNSPQPQFIDDLGQPFSVHFLKVMYPDEEVEFSWNLRAPDYQEIADVVYPHTIDWSVSYDYTSGLLQTVYVINEQEYQRELRVNGVEPTTTGTVTGEVGAIDIDTVVDGPEPVRVQNNNDQFNIIYIINKNRDGYLVSPMLFLLQYPDGVSFAGREFDGAGFLEEEGYLDLNSVVNHYINTLGPTKFLDGAVCLPEDYDPYDEIYANAKSPVYHKKLEDDDRSSRFFSYIMYESPDTYTITCGEGYKAISLNDLFSYIHENFPDLEINYSNPNIVLKFRYPVDLIEPDQKIYFPFRLNENVEISKYYTFRLKTKYRFSFEGHTSISVVPNEELFSRDTYVSGLFRGSWKMDFTKPADSSSSSGTMPNEVLFEKNGIEVRSLPIEMNNGRFMHIIGVNSDDYEQPFGASVGYFTEGNFINTMLSTSTNFYNIPEGTSLYLVDIYPFTSKLDEPSRESISAVNDIDVSDISQVYSFINGRAFFKVYSLVDGSSVTALSDSDKIGYNVDITYDNSESDIPNSMKLISYNENESLFVKNIDLGADGNLYLVGLFSSNEESIDYGKLLLFLISNSDSDDEYVLQYNISLVDSANYDNYHRKLTNLNDYADNDDYSLEGKGDYIFLKRTLAGMDYVVKCGPDESERPALIIDYYIGKNPHTDSDNNLIIDDVESGSIVIANYSNENEFRNKMSALVSSKGGSSWSISKFVKGVVSLCYKRED